MRINKKVLKLFILNDLDIYSKTIFFMTRITDEVKGLFRKVRKSIGGGVRTVELDDETLCDLLEMCVEDYAERVHSFLIETQWMSLYGKNISRTDFAFALSTKTFDMSKDYSYWFSKNVGLQQEGPWELKKDFFTIEKGKQVYMIPSGRTINKVMYVNPPVSQAALFANYGGIDIGFGGGYAQLGGGAYGPVGGFYTAPAADVAYLATDIQYKNRLLRSDLVYKVTAGPEGTKLIHLLSTPGSRLSFGHTGGVAGGIGLVGCEVWYTYYDTFTKDEEDECTLANIDDVILTPEQVPLAKMDYNYLNEPTKVLVRQLLVAKAKETIGNIRGTFSGKVHIPQAELQMDYQMLINQGQQEYQKVMENLEKRLERLNPAAVLETQAKIVQQNLEIQKATPLGIFVI